jgi:hypothetical protein
MAEKQSKGKLDGRGGYAGSEPGPVQRPASAGATSGSSASSASDGSSGQKPRS